MPNLVKITNTSPDKDLPLRHDGMGDIVVPPGAETIVPFSYAAVCFGHPATRNEGVDRARDTVYSQVLTRWGMYPGINEDEWDDLMPSFEVHTMEGERLWTVLEDPEGTRGDMPVMTSPEDATSKSLQSQVAALQAQIDQLVKIGAVNESIDKPTPAAEASPLPDDAPKDLPTLEDMGIGETQAERNELRDELPKPAKRKVSKDGPTSRATKK